MTVDYRKTMKRLEIANPVRGQVIPVSEVRDIAFSSGGIGDGVGILPEAGEVYAPVSGTVEDLFPTKHALTIEAEGVKIFIHIGIDTVELDGRGFHAYIKNGEHVTRGDLLVTFDKEFLERNGYDPTVVCIVTEKESGKLEAETGRIMDAMEPVMRIVQE